MSTTISGFSIMYIGLKSRKWDNANKRPDRVWNGAGDIVDGISQVQAEKLLQHKDEFVNVTGFTAEQRIARAQKARIEAEEKRRSLRVVGKAGAVLLEHATDEQLLKELERRKLSREIKQAAPQELPPMERPTSRRDESSQQFVTEKVLEALDVILERGNPDDLDRDGMPTKSAVEDVIGFSISDAEFAAALGPKAPAEPLDKTGFSDEPDGMPPAA